VKYAVRLAVRKEKLQLFYLKKLEIHHSWKRHPTVFEFEKNFASNRAQYSNPECDVIVTHPKTEAEYDRPPKIIATYANGVVEELNINQRINALVAEFYAKRQRLEAEADFEEGWNEEEENPFLDQALIDEATSTKKKPSQKKQRVVKED